MWLARDRDNALYLFDVKPFLEKGKFWPIESEFHYLSLPSRQFPEVTFENSPIECNLSFSKSNQENDLDILKKLDGYCKHLHELGLNKICLSSGTIILN